MTPGPDVDPVPQVEAGGFMPPASPGPGSSGAASSAGATSSNGDTPGPRSDTPSADVTLEQFIQGQSPSACTVRRRLGNAALITVWCRFCLQQPSGQVPPPLTPRPSAARPAKLRGECDGMHSLSVRRHVFLVCNVLTCPMPTDRAPPDTGTARTLASPSPHWPRVW